MINRRALLDARKIGRGPCGSSGSHIRQASISRRRRGKDIQRAPVLLLDMVGPKERRKSQITDAAHSPVPFEREISAWASWNN